MQSEKEKYSDIYSRYNCLKTLKNMKKFVENNNGIKNEKQKLNLLRSVLEECSKNKECPPGEYTITGECLPG